MMRTPYVLALLHSKEKTLQNINLSEFLDNSSALFFLDAVQSIQYDRVENGVVLFLMPQPDITENDLKLVDFKHAST